MRKKAPARLTGTLLVRKGEATPTLAVAPAPAKPSRANGMSGRGTRNGIRHLVAVPRLRTNSHAGKRVAMTLRLDPERHLRLKLFTVQAGRSAQDVLTTAIDEYLSQFHLGGQGKTATRKSKKRK